MMINIRDLAKDLTMPALISIVCLLIALAGSELSDLLRYDSEKIAQFELWRLVTPHFVHLTWGHLVMNILGLLLVFFFFSRCVATNYWIKTFAASALGISILIFFFNPEIRWYVGLSGVLHSLFLLGGIADIRVRKWEGIAFTLLITGKVVYEQVLGPLPGSEETAGGPVLVDAHFYGAIIGAIAGIFYVITRRNHPQQ